MSEPPVFNHPFKWDFVLSVVEHRLGMWVGRPTYERAVALVIGFDMAQPESIERPMQSRIQAHHDTVPTGWPWVLLAEALGGDVHNPGDPGGLTPEADAKAITLLVAELRAVLRRAAAS